ncbi:hypothetical protein [Paracoccus sediminicola]|uniref:hypothetical protein n=1 Tax=Paracoccus sediminicola TaxID=3017783 RepID=UPI0022F113EC|nr:hypothetical protein [Paracoccus sediminicola]WBU55771.1 hypothetical protein PAF18_09635 [Paracoccus sediminicola]
MSSALGDTLRWGAAGAVVLGLHLAGGVWLIERMQRAEALQPPEPIFIDLAPVPEPAPGPQTAPEPQAEAAEQAEAASQAQAEQLEVAEPAAEIPSFTPPEMSELPPVEDFADLVPVPSFEPPPMTELPPVSDFAELLPQSALALSASERPTARPARRQPQPAPQQARREPPREEPRQQAQPRQQAPQPAQRQQAAPAQLRQQAQPTQRQPSRAASGGGGAAQSQGRGVSRQQMANWQSRAGARIARHMSRTRVPGVRGGTVTVQISVTVSPGGGASARLASSTGNGQADQALARQAARMPGVGAPPNGQSVSFVLPIQVALR